MKYNTMITSSMYKIITISNLDDLCNLNTKISEGEMIVYDLSKINLINSTLISYITIRGKVLALLNPTPRVLLLIKVLGIDKLVPIIYNIEEADELLLKATI